MRHPARNGLFVADDCSQFWTRSGSFYEVRVEGIHVPSDISLTLIPCRHAGRSTIDTKDVMLLTRRNEGLQELLQNYLSEMQVRKQ